MIILIFIALIKLIKSNMIVLNFSNQFYQFLYQLNHYQTNLFIIQQGCRKIFFIQAGDIA